MLVNPKFVIYSPFFITALKVNDSDAEDMESYYKRLNHFSIDTLLPKKVGMFGLVGDNQLNPIYHDDRQQYKDIKISKIKSYLKRNRYLSNKKHSKDWNDNYRALYHPTFLNSNDFENFDDFILASNKNKQMSITPYGACDTPEQIYNRLNFLNKVKDQEFFISVSFVHKSKLKDGESSYGGYRQHKNGGYFGTKLLEHEYLADEKEIKNGIFSFHVVSLKPSKKNVIKEQNFIFVESRLNSKHHTIFDARNDSMLICYMFEKDGSICVGDGVITLLSYPKGEDIDYKRVNDDLFVILSEFESKHTPQ